MGERVVLVRMKVREATEVFPSRAAANPALDDLLLAGFDRADIEVLAEGKPLRRRIGDIAVPAPDLADVPEAPRQESVTPEDTAGNYALCISVASCLGAMICAIAAIASQRTTAPTVIPAVVGGAIGCGSGMLIARRLGWRWRQSPMTPAGSNGLVHWVRVRTPEREQAARRILEDRRADAAHLHEIEIEKHLEDLPLSSLGADPWLGERLGKPR